MEKVEVFIAKADPITDKKEVKNAEIHIKNSIPDFSTFSEAEEYYKSDAFNLYKVLKNHLPQGTQHQLLIIMLLNSEKLYRGT